MRRPLLALAFSLCASAAMAQTAENATPPSPTVSQLLAEGYQLVSMQYLANSIVVMLQRTAEAYICDLTFNGETKICVTLK